MQMQMEYKVGDRVRALTPLYFREAPGGSYPAGRLGTVVDGHDRMYDNAGSEFTPEQIAMATAAAKLIYPVAVKWDDVPLDDLGNDFIIMAISEIEPA